MRTQLAPSSTICSKSLRGLLGDGERVAVALGANGP